jgi:flagellum-specific ATP synthase
MVTIVTKQHKDFAGRLKNVLATYNEAEDLINIGAYKGGTNPDIDYAIKKIKEVNAYLCQETDEKFVFDDEVGLLEQVFAD